MKLYLFLPCLLLGACTTLNPEPEPDMHIIPTAPEYNTQTVPEPTQTSSEPTQTAPEYTHAIPIPLKVGVMLDDSPISDSYGLVVIKEWEKMQLFDSLVYPYQENDPVNIVMRLSIISSGEKVITDTEEIVERELENEDGYVVKEVVEETLLKMRRTLLAINRKDDVEEGFYDDEDYHTKSYSDEGIYFDPIIPIKHDDPPGKKTALQLGNIGLTLIGAGACLFAYPICGAPLIAHVVTDTTFDLLFPYPPSHSPFSLFSTSTGKTYSKKWGSTGSSGSKWGGWSFESGGVKGSQGAQGAQGDQGAQGTTFTHDALAVINQSSNEIGQYSVQVATTIQLGNKLLKDAHGRNYVEGYDAGYELQGKRLAFELAKKIRADRKNLLSKLGKSQEETKEP